MKIKKTFFIFCTFFVFYLNDNSFAQNWALMYGDCSPTLNPTYGTLGVSSASVNPGGRKSGCSFTDASGNFWLFGGFMVSYPGPYNYLGDLWKYTISTNQWTWMGGTNQYNQAAFHGTMGVATSSNQPGGRFGSMSWTDLAGNFWIFGGQYAEYANGPMFTNDLWKYDVSTGQWTWMSGTSTTNDLGAYGTQGVPSTTVYPGARMGGASWTDLNGRLWLYGGRKSGLNLYLFNDLWMYDPANNQWTWVKGGSATNVINMYGTVGVASNTNNPCSRGEYPLTWVDNGGDLWMYSGLGCPSTSVNFALPNDLWKFNISSNQWTCVNASSSQLSGLTPMGRAGACTWKNSGGDFLVFGGGSSYGTRSDVWKYNISSDQWTAVTPHYTTASCCTYNIASPFANPSPVGNSFSWVDNCGNLWATGGETGNGSQNYPNALWKLNMAGAVNTNTMQPQHVCNGQTATLNVTSPGNITWYSTMTSTTPINTGPTYTLGPLTGSTYAVYAESSTCTLSPTRTEILVIVALPTVSIFGNSTVCIGSSLSQTVTGLNTATWSTGSNSGVISLSPTVNSTYSVAGTDIYGCYGSASKTITVYSLPTVSISGPDTICKTYPAILTASGASTYSWSTGGTTSSISTTPASSTIYTVTGTSVNGCKSKSTHTLYIKPTPFISINSGAICMSQVFTLQVISSISYTLSSPTTTVSPLSTTIYTALNTGTNGCVGVALSTVVVNPIPFVSAANGTVCPGQSFTINPVGADWYTFSNGSAVGIVSPTVTTTYTFTGTSLAGCVSQIPGTVQVSYFPNPTISVSNGTVCSGELFSIQGTGANTYSFVGGSMILFPTSDTICSVIGESLAGCISAPVNCTIDVMPLPNISISSSDSILCEGEYVTLIASGADSYTWTSGLNSNSMTIQPLTNTTYTVNGVDTNGCANSQTYLQMVDACDAITENTISELRVFPNPARDLFSIEIGSTHENAEVKIYSELGQVVLARTISLGTNTISVKGFRKGLYTVVISGINAPTRVMKLVVE